MLPDFVDAILAAGENDPALLRERLESCGNLDDGVFQVQDVNGDDVDDLILVYRDATAQSAAAAMDLMIYVGGEDGFVRSYRAKAAGQILLRNTEDINQDGQPDLLWTDTTCGATNCFAAVNVRSWDGAAWVDWTDGTITLANLDAISLADAESLEGMDAQGSVISLKGGVFAGEAAGPQRARTELWASVDGAPYTLAEVTNADSDCLYHVILDANALVLTNTEADLASGQRIVCRCRHGRRAGHLRHPGERVGRTAQLQPLPVGSGHRLSWRSRDRVACARLAERTVPRKRLRQAGGLLAHGLRGQR